jgi:hypothetical protein
MTQWFKDTTKPNQSIIGRDYHRSIKSIQRRRQCRCHHGIHHHIQSILEAVNKAYTVYKESDADSGATNKEEKGESK